MARNSFHEVAISATLDGFNWTGPDSNRLGSEMARSVARLIAVSPVRTGRFSLDMAKVARVEHDREVVGAMLGVGAPSAADLT